MKTLAIVLIVVSLVHFGTTLNCYTCSVGEQDTDRTCIDHPENTVVTDCHKKYCTLIRQDYLHPEDKIASIYRGCEDNPMHKNVTINDDTYIFYYTACQESLCNGGSGKWDSH